MFRSNIYSVNLFHDKLTYLHITIHIFISVILCLSSCSSGNKKIISSAVDTAPAKHHVYIVSKGIHTGLIIPRNTISDDAITALRCFEKAGYIEFGWGEEEFYQTPGRKYCMGITAVIFPNPSVVRVEGFSGLLDDVIKWSDYTVQFMLTDDQFTRLCIFVDESFRRDDNKLMETSRKRNGEVIFFKSIYRYHMFSTCNTWAARALNAAGLDVSSFMVITAGGLFDEVRDDGVILKGN